MKKYMLTLLCIVALMLSGCSLNKESKAEVNADADADTEQKTEETVPEEESKYIIDNDEVSVIDYTKFDFEKTSAKETSEEEMQEYVDYLLESYEAETGNDLGEEKIPTQDAIDWLTDEEGHTEEEFYDIIKGIMDDYNANESKYDDMNTLYNMLVNDSVLNNYTDEEMAAAKEKEITFIESSAKYADTDLEAYKTDVLELSTEEEYAKYVEDAALTTIKSDKVIKAVADKESIEVSDEEYNEYLISSVSYYGYESEEDLLSVYSEDELKMDILYNKVLDYIYNLY